MNHLARRIVPALLGAVLVACASPSPAPVLLTLPPAAPEAALASPAAASAPVLAVRRVAIPEYLVARRVRYRADPRTLAEWPNTYWAERIEIAVTREFMSALRAQLPAWSLCDTNCGDQVATRALQVELVPMDYLRASQLLRARARVTVTDGGAVPRVIATQELPYDLPVGADTAQAQAQAIAELVRRVAAAAGPMVSASSR